jgi:HSP20 family protein
MAKDIEAQPRPDRPARLWEWFEGPDFDRWFGGLRPFGGGRLRIEQKVTDEGLVIRGEMPGVDPEKDVDITIENGMLRIHAERSYEKKEEKEGRTRSEFEYGSFERTMRLPDGVDPDEIAASYKDGILEITVPYKVPSDKGSQKIAITKG